MKFIKITNKNGRWHADLISDRRTIEQFRDEAGIKHAPWPDKPEAYDLLLEAAGKHGYGLVTTENE